MDSSIQNIPSASGNGTCSPLENLNNDHVRVKVRPRRRYMTDHQRYVLQHQYKHNPYCRKHVREQIACQLGLTTQQIKVINYRI